MPRIDDLIDGLGQAQFISTLDLMKGYWQVPVHLDSRPKTAFVTPLGKYQFTVMPFGLVGAPATFQRLMNSVVADFQEFASAYLDDVVVFSTSWEDHIHHLTSVFDVLVQAGLTAKLAKCQLGLNQCFYLGHMVGEGLVRPEEAKVSAIQEFQTPKKKKDVRSFWILLSLHPRFQHHSSPPLRPHKEQTEARSHIEFSTP